MTETVSRTVERIVFGQPTSDGAGVKLLRVLTHDLQRRLDPFLMLDEFRSDNPGDYIAGFPEHPHRGFETVTYMLDGRMRHRDSAGNEGLLGPGGLQWMTAGRGLMHSEIPEQEDGLMHGFQLWVNLPARRKMIPPAYRDLPAEAIPIYQPADGVEVKAIAGAYDGLKGAIERPDTEPVYLDIRLEPSREHFFRLPETHNAFVYVYDGAADVGSPARTVTVRQMAILSNTAGAGGVCLATGATPVRLLLIAGQPLNEPIAQYGPFVMNSRAELEQAFTDLRSGRFGQETA
ncbi:pirin family protein [Gulbenkiania mobilis]|uniref:Pirin n=1 Tax=Gulbenkiania mobilis TaxID=397457 RepID=A0ABY2CY00_GULMO|nr:hypothetical protein EV669_10315 [Gulbenkiania mobilis]